MLAASAKVRIFAFYAFNFNFGLVFDQPASWAQFATLCGV